MPLPLTNATLTQIAGSGFSPDWDQGSGSDTVRWTGSTPAYVTEVMRAATESAGDPLGRGKDAGLELSEFKVTRIVVDKDPGKLIKRGDTVTYNWGDINGLQRVVADAQTYELFGTTRVWLRED
jgi:hypothetical protein